MLNSRALARCVAPVRLRAVSAARNLTSLELREPKEKPAPWPYEKRGFEFYHFYDFPLKRMDESTKFIVVEGNIGSGKSSFAKELAKRFGFLHLKEPSPDDILINFYGKDERDFYEEIPERCRVFDFKMFYENPYHVNVAFFQFLMYSLRYENYENAIAHLLNTGQGVVMEGSPWSDLVFANAMNKKSCISKDFYEWYIRMRDSSLPFVSDLRPHLVVHLDVKPEVCLERIQKRGIDYEVKSEIMDLDYLTEIDRSFKTVMKDHDRHSGILIYDWNTPGDLDYVVEDIENSNMGDTFDWHEGDKFETWHTPWSNWDWNYIRQYHTGKVGLTSLTYPSHDVAEMWVHPDDMKAYCKILEDKVHGYYQTGWNPDKDGFANVLLGKSGAKKWQRFTASSWIDNYINGRPVMM